MYICGVGNLYQQKQTKMTTSFNLSLDNEINKVYSNFNQAKAIFTRLISLKAAQQKKYDGVQVLDHVSIDEVIVHTDGSLEPVEYLEYFDGAKLVS